MQYLDTQYIPKIIQGKTNNQHKSGNTCFTNKYNRKKSLKNQHNECK